MSRFIPIEGIVTSVSPIQTGETSYNPCSLFLTLRDINQQDFNAILSSSTYVLNQEPILQGQTITVFYDSLAPMPLIYPPQYQAVAVVHSVPGRFAVMDYFNRNLINSDNTLRLNLSGNTLLRLHNGQYYLGIPGNQYLLVLYSSTTRSIPALTTPEEVTVFCQNTP